MNTTRSQMFFKIDIFKKFANFTENYLRLSLFLTKLQAFRPATLLKKTPTCTTFPFINTNTLAKQNNRIVGYVFFLNYDVVWSLEKLVFF